MMVELIVALVLSGAQAPQQRTPTPPPPTGRAPSPPTAPANPPQPSQVTIPLCPGPSGGIPASTGNSAGTASGPVSTTCSGGSLSGMGGPTVPH